MTELRTAATVTPGTDTLAVLAAAEPSALSPAELIDAVITAERLLAHVNGLQTRLFAELGRPHRCGDVSELVGALVDKAGQALGPDGQADPLEVAELIADRSIGLAAAEVGAVLDWSPVTARIRIKQSMRMVSDLPATAAALLQGRVDAGRARMIVDRTAVVAPELCGPIERRILPLVRGRSRGRLETLVDREVIAADPEAAENRRLAAIKDRSVSHRPDKDGMGVITALLPAEAAVLVFTLIDLIAAANKGLDGRTVDQRRADAVADIADELLTYGFVDLDGLVARAQRGTATDPDTAATATDAADATDTDTATATATTATATTATATDAAPATDTATATDAAAATDAATDATTTDAATANAATANAATADAAAATDAATANSATADAATEPAASAPAPAVPARPAPPVPTPSAPGVPVPPAPVPSAAVAVPAAEATSAKADSVDRAGRLARAATRHGRRPHLTVTGAWTTLTGADDLPGHLEGHGTITAPLLRAIAESWGTLTAVGVDATTGTGTAIGSLTYRPGRRVSDQVITLSGTCRAAGCRMPAAKCDLDHLQPFDHTDPAAGGRTTLANQIPLCRFHHLLKHHADWTPHLRADMTIVWTTTTGHTATSYPREFTAPGEWQRPQHSHERRADRLPGADGSPDVDQPPSAARPAQSCPAQSCPAQSCADLIVGPVVAGPTIPVVPAGADYQEAHTQLEDPATVPHPGSVEITTYRIMRADVRQHALRRLGRLAAPTDSLDTGPAAAERHRLEQNVLTVGRLTDSLSDMATPPGFPPDRPLPDRPLPDRPLPDRPLPECPLPDRELPDEPPF